MTATRRLRRRTPETPLARLVAWTTVLALVFSAGLITGQRLWSRSKDKPLVAIASSHAASKPAALSKKPKADDAKLTFSFYDELGQPKAGAPDGARADAQPNARGGAPERAIKGVIADAVTDLARRKPDALPARYTLQVGSHESLARARRQMNRLRERGEEPHLSVVELEDKGKVFRVRVGKFASMDEARHYQAELHRARNIKAMLSPL